MPTRVMLHGGNTERMTAKNATFYKEIIDSVDKATVHVLCVYFARPEHRWQDSYAEDQTQFGAVQTGKQIVTTLAAYDSFERDIEQTDVIFINGGTKGHLKETLLQIGVERVRQLTDGKIIAGASAGANMLARYYYSSVIDGVREGIGFIDAKVFTHYSSEKSAKLEELKAYGDGLPVVAVAEEEYLDFTKK